MAIVSPVRGFLPWRAARSLALKVPNPAVVTDSPCPRALAMVSNTARTAEAASDFESDVLAATFDTRSARFMDAPPIVCGERWSTMRRGLSSLPRFGEPMRDHRGCLPPSRLEDVRQLDAGGDHVLRRADAAKPRLCRAAVSLRHTHDGAANQRLGVAAKPRLCPVDVGGELVERAAERQQRARVLRDVRVLRVVDDRPRSPSGAAARARPSGTLRTRPPRPRRPCPGTAPARPPGRVHSGA